MSAAVTIPTPQGKLKLRVLTNSELREARACLRRHKYKYRLRRRPRLVAEPLTFGSAFHAGQEQYWSCDGTLEEKVACAIDGIRAYAAKAAAKGERVNEYALVTVEELTIGYAARWADSDLRAVAVEQTFELPLINPETGAASRTFRLGGKYDGIVVDGEGRLHVLEHKTTASDLEFGSLYWAKVKALDTQVSLYIAGAKAAGYDVEDCIYDVIRKPGIRPLKATSEESRKYKKDGSLYANQREHDETPEEFRLRVREDIAERPERYYARGNIVRLEVEEREFAFDMWQAAKLLNEAERSGYSPKNPDSCSTFGTCEYLSVCSGEASIDNEALFRTSTSAHEELETA